MNLRDYENPFAGDQQAGIVMSVDVENGVVYGDCLHGMPLQALGSSVLFVEPCGVCAGILRAEGYFVQGPTLSLAA